MSRKSRTTLTFTVSLPLPQKCSQKEAAEFLRFAVANAKETLHQTETKSPFAFLSAAEVIIKQTGRETVYL